jgi:hypothetical protein
MVRRDFLFFHRRLLMHLEMEVFDILEEVLYLVFATQFHGPETKQQRKARKARNEELDLDQQYPQGLAYVCCPLLFLLLRQEEESTEAESKSSSGMNGNNVNSSGAFLSESQRIIARPANSQEEKIIKRKLIDFYLQKLQVDLYNLVCSIYQLKDSGMFVCLFFYIY